MSFVQRNDIILILRNMKMKYEVTISKSGSITIPAAVRDELGLQPGQSVKQSIERNRILLDFGREIEKVAKVRVRKNK